VASGSQLTKVDKGFRELAKLGLVDDSPYRIYGAQAEGCSPVATAFRDGRNVIRPVKPDTIVKSLAIGNPADGPYVLDVCHRTGGTVESVTDDEVREGISLLARTEGIFGRRLEGLPSRRSRSSWTMECWIPRSRPWCSTPETPEDARRHRGPGRSGSHDRTDVRRVHRSQPVRRRGHRGENAATAATKTAKKTVRVR